VTAGTRRVVVAIGLVGATVLASCGEATGPATPSTPIVAGASSVASASSVAPAPPAGPPVLGLDWGRAVSVDLPEEAFALPTLDAGPTIDPGSGRSGHPQHFPGQAIMADVVRLSGGSLVSVGYVNPGWRPAAWTSDDASAWTLRDMGTTGFTFPVALAAADDGGVVAVGRSGSAPLAWTSRDGRSWQANPVPTLGDGTVAERMTTVLATPDGFIAGGSLGPELFERHARFWLSADGSTWRPVADDPGAFANAEVRSIVRFGAGYVAIGVLGTAQQITGSVAWTSRDGRSWKRIEDPSLARGRAVALVAAPTGQLVAVGSDLDEREAFAWTSPDGRSWTLAASEASRQYPGKIRMTDVTVVGDELVGVGNYVGVQYGTATSWISRDGRSWQAVRSAAVQEQGEFYAAIPAGPGLVVVGSFGAPDNYIPTVWLSPAR
jgi:hypothetical protein